MNTEPENGPLEDDFPVVFRFHVGHFRISSTSHARPPGPDGFDVLITFHRCPGRLLVRTAQVGGGAFVGLLPAVATFGRGGGAARHGEKRVGEKHQCARLLD